MSGIEYSYNKTSLTNLSDC